MKTHRLDLLKLLTMASIAACLAACGGGESEGDDDEHGGSFSTSTAIATDSTAGQALYNAYCASCHGVSYSPGKNYASTLSAIARNKGGMGYLSANIQTSQANDIATYLTYGASTSTKTSQTISFTSPGNQTLGAAPAAMSATSDAGLTVAITSSTPDVCSATNSTLTLVAAGTCTLTASQTGNTAYAPAAPVTVSLTVAAAAAPVTPALQTQTIVFTTPGDQLMGVAPPALTATASSNLAVVFTSASNSVCTVSGTTLSLRQPGTCKVTANQAGDATYAAAATVSNSFYVVSPGAAAGKTAYNLAVNGQSCASCHGLPGSQAVSNIFAAANADVVLSSAIINNKGGMGVLANLYTQQQILDITAYLATPGI